MCDNNGVVRLFPCLNSKECMKFILLVILKFYKLNNALVLAHDNSITAYREYFTLLVG